MKSYILIENPGEMIPEDLYLMGTSPKRDNDNLIGQYCTGNKYGLAGCFRWDAIPTIFSGKEIIKLDSDLREYRGEIAEVITINGKETSITSKMGIDDWLPWMVIREFVSNAMDAATESGNPEDYIIDVVHNPVKEGISGRTRIYIPMTSEFSEVLMHFDKYFAFKRNAYYCGNGFKVFLKKEESPMVVYRKGIRAYTLNDQSFLDFDFEELPITENRLASWYDVSKAIKKAIKDELPEEVLKLLIKSAFYKVSLLPNIMPLKYISYFKKWDVEGEVFSTPGLVSMIGILGHQNQPTMLVSTEWYKVLVSYNLAKDYFDKTLNDSVLQNFIPLANHKDTELIIYYLKGIGLDIKIKTGNWEGLAGVAVLDGIGYIKYNINSTAVEIAAKLVKSMPISLLVNSILEMSGEGN